MQAKDLARSACRIFGHTWEHTKYRAAKDPYTRQLVIARVRMCKRCGQVEEVQK